MKLKNVFSLLILMCAVCHLSAQSPLPESIEHFQELENFPELGCCPMTEPQNSDYEIVFEDNFDGNTLNMDNWHTDRPDGNRCYWTGSWTPLAEAVWFGDVGENVFVENGLLRLKAGKQNPPQQCGNKLAKYSVGQVWSQDHFRYGKFEFSFKVPKGAALYPSIWMQTNNGGGRDEIDIMESFGKPGNNNPVAYSNGALNASGNSYGVFGQALGDRAEVYPLTYDSWAIAELTWTPYELFIKINGTTTMHIFKYYFVCGDTFKPIKCNTPNPITSCNEEVKFIENMSFPDDEMKINIWLNFMPYADWSGGTLISETNTDIPSYFEIGYVKVKQLPEGTWEECENQLFCTYSIPGNLEETINICSDGLEIDPDEFALFPSGPSSYDIWSSATLETSSSLFAHINEDDLHLDEPYPLSGSEWIEIHIPDDADPSCIGQNRVLRKELEFTYTGDIPNLLIDGNVVLQDPEIYQNPNYVPRYYVSTGAHEIDIEGLVPNEIEYYRIKVLQGGAYSENEPLAVDVDNWKYINVKVVYANGCERNYRFILEPMCEESIFELTLDEENLTAEGFFLEQFHSLCYGQYPVEFNSNGSSYEIFSVEGVNLTTNEVTTIPLDDSGFSISPGSEEYLIRITLQSSDETCEDIVLELTIIGYCCYPGGICEQPDGCLDHVLYPNPTSDYINIQMPDSAIDGNGETYQPKLSEIKVFDLFGMNTPIQLNMDGVLSTYSLDVSALQNGQTYVLEIKDQQGKWCHENLIISD